MTIVEFLEARLMEDEAVAKEPHHQNWDLYPYWFRPNGEDPAEGSVIAAERVPDGALSGLIRYITGPEEIDLADAAHVARHDPARVLREVAAKRAILAQEEAARSQFEHVKSSATYPAIEVLIGQVAALATVIRHLASAYSDHPDFNPDWAE